ncbi:hypothetical protein AAF712_008962 [Marasmius tenuissimus]|uniref:Glucose-methanol-choline oxidoreductase N-terminal domain-containing protein n=1 Tax=Marasmius tenuissimus TaxID=585030 RepID=A0ABR2ZSM1_9AGAR
MNKNINVPLVNRVEKERNYGRLPFTYKNGAWGKLSVSAMALPLIAIISLVTLAKSSYGAIYEKFSDVPARQFDFIVVGGGTAGNVIANRLTENPDFSVLVLEAGGSHENLFTPQVPAMATTLAGSNLDWNFTAQLRPGDKRPYNRGFVLGGSSTINWMAYTRGSSDDWDRYAAVTGDEGWSWENMQLYIRKNEQIVPPADRHDTTGHLSGFMHELDKRTIDVSKSFGDQSELKFVLDMNSGDQLGFGWAQSTILNGTRSSSATSYLGPKYINRPNLHVLVDAKVTRILRTGSKNGKLVFSRVQFTQDNGETLQSAVASKEVILSAGTLGTPHILLNSGIGDNATLSALGVETFHHLPSVGQNLTDQPSMLNGWVVNTTDTNETNLKDPQLLKQWQETRTGPLVDPIIGTFGWLRVPEDAPVFQRVEDPAAGPKTAHYELVTINGIRRGTPEPGKNYISMGNIVVSPASRGSVTLASSNPLEYPSVDLNLFDSEFDLYAMGEALRSTKKLMGSPIWDGYLMEPTFDVNMDNDEELYAYILANFGYALHPTGTASMSPKGASWGVVDPDLLVKGVFGLRVVDASVMPFVPAAHTQAPTYMVGERGADLIKKDWM